jgi:hypothetical protein
LQYSGLTHLKPQGPLHGAKTKSAVVSQAIGSPRYPLSVCQADFNLMALEPISLQAKSHGLAQKQAPLLGRPTAQVSQPSQDLAGNRSGQVSRTVATEARAQAIK